MAYRFKRDETVAQSVHRIAHEELDSAARRLAHAGPAMQDEAIHEARKSVKKIRALLRLVQSELGDTYDGESQILRKAGRTLFELRDTGSVIEILKQLRGKYPGELRQPMFAAIRRGLVARKKRLEARENSTTIFRDIAGTLAMASKRGKTWPIPVDGFAALKPGIERAFRKGRTAFLAAQEWPSPENFHDWRKRVKDHWYHVRLLEDLWTEWIQGYEASLKDVETWLGDDHNLVLLRDLLIREPDLFGNTKSIELVADLIEKQQKELRANAESLGGRIYQEKPRHLARQMRRLWEEWHSDPKSLEEFEKRVRKKSVVLTA
jgi:CHAD domain-containing protein